MWSFLNLNLKTYSPASFVKLLETKLVCFIMFDNYSPTNPADEETTDDKERNTNEEENSDETSELKLLQGLTVKSCKVITESLRNRLAILLYVCILVEYLGLC